MTNTSVLASVPSAPVASVVSGPQFSVFSKPVVPSGCHEIWLTVDGVHCANCIWNIETKLKGQPDVTEARLNFSTKRLHIVWMGDPTRADNLAHLVQDLGYRVTPYQAGEKPRDDEARELLIAMVVAGFASNNIMMFSVPLWASTLEDMGFATREMMHWYSAIIAFPTVIFSGIPFFRSAWRALRSGRTNMDVPISVGVIFSCLMSLHQTIVGAEHAYYDAAVMLLFFLLIGRYLDVRARGQARAYATDLLAMMGGSATVEDGDGKTRLMLARELQPGMVVRVAVGEKIGADGHVLSGESSVDAALITGETIPQPVQPGAAVFAGTINLDQPLRVEVAKPQDGSILSQIVRLMEQAEQGQAKYVRLADRVARAYTPVVHIMALATFVLWYFGLHAVWQDSAMYALSVLIITCPCALGLAVPVVQVLATSELMKRGILVKSGDAFERLARADTLVFDKTGTLTLGRPSLLSPDRFAPADLRLAASLAQFSRHPLSEALVRAYGQEDYVPVSVIDHPGFGLEATVDGKRVRLGRLSWVAPHHSTGDVRTQSVALLIDGRNDPVVFTFADQLRPDAASTMAALKKLGYRIELLSGDLQSVVDDVAQSLSIDAARGGLTPPEKTAIIQEHKAQGHSVVMIGDGLNDAPSLLAADASISPSSAIDMAQNAADLVFTGTSLRAVLQALQTARLSQKLVRQNIAMSLIYNVFAIPVAVAGYVTPMLAALAMSSSSLFVVGNSFRLMLFLRRR